MKLKNPFKKTPAPKTGIIPIQLLRIVQDAQTRKDAVAEAERAYWPYRYKMQQMFLNTIDNLHIKSVMERRKDLSLLRKWYFGTAQDQPDDAITLLFKETWFTNFMNHALDALFYGYSLIEMNDLINNKFPKLGVIKRWNVSPDRYEIMSFPYMVSGIKFLEDDQYKDWYVYIDTPNEIGTSPCGYGLLYDISIAEIFLRNNLGFNGTFVELFAQPFRHGKTFKTDETERAEFAAMLQNLGSAGWAITDPTEEITLLESSLGGTGYKSYDNLELRLQKLISKLVLGHADAIDSTPGKLGSGQAEDNPVYQALRDKQVKDGTFLENIVNDILIPQLVNLGFSIPEGVKFFFKNDSEVMEVANTFADLATKIKTGGLQMDDKYFTEQTGIKVSLPAPSPMGGGFGSKPPMKQSTKNRLNMLYK